MECVFIECVLLQLLGKLRQRSGAVLYPSFMLCTETSRHFIMELVGAQRNFSDLPIKIHKERSTDRYFGQFSPHAERPLFVLEASAHEFSNLTMSRALDPAATQRRFPWLSLMETGPDTDGDGSLREFASSFQSGVFEN